MQLDLSPFITRLPRHMLQGKFQHGQIDLLLQIFTPLDMSCCELEKYEPWTNGKVCMEFDIVLLFVEMTFLSYYRRSLVWMTIICGSGDSWTSGPKIFGLKRQQNSSCMQWGCFGHLIKIIKKTNFLQKNSYGLLIHMSHMCQSTLLIRINNPICVSKK